MISTKLDLTLAMMCQVCRYAFSIIYIVNKQMKKKKKSHTEM